MTQLTARADRRHIRPYDHSHRYVLAEVTAPPATRQLERTPVNLAFVIDRSGSMSGEKLELAKRAVEAALARLDGRDRFSVIVYDDVVETVVESTTASAEARRLATSRLATIEARGSTDLAGGWFRGCEQVASRLGGNGIDRVLLLTDGLANVGIKDPTELATHARELRARGVATSTFGVGNDFDETLLQAMADAGGGHFYYIADAAQIRDHIASEVGETLEVVARDVELEVQAGEGILVDAISPQPLTKNGSRTIVALGDLVADQVQDIVLRLTFPFGQLGRDTGILMAITDRDGVFEAAGVRVARLTWTWADDPTNDGQPRDPDVDRAVARQFAARARQQAVRYNRDGDFDAAQAALRATAKRIRRYAASDPVLREVAGSLEAQGDEMAVPMSAALAKQVYSDSYYAARSRDPMGRSRKSR